MQWRHQTRRAAPSHVFLMLFANDVRDDRAMTELAETGEDGDVVAVSGVETSLVTRLSRMTYFGRLLRKTQLQLEWAWEHRGEARAAPLTTFVEENPDISPLTDSYLKRLVAETRASSAELVLMAVPSKERTLRPAARTGEPVFHDKVQQWAEINAVPFIDLSQAFYTAADAGAQLFFTRDIHFTEVGHELVAEQIQTAYPGLFGTGAQVVMPSEQD